MREGSKQKSGPIILTCDPGWITNLLPTLPPTPTLSLPTQLSPTPPRLFQATAHTAEGARGPASPALLGVPCTSPVHSPGRWPASKAPDMCLQVSSPFVPQGLSTFQSTSDATFAINSPQVGGASTHVLDCEIRQLMYKPFLSPGLGTLEADTPLPNSSACCQLGTQRTGSAAGGVWEMRVPVKVSPFLCVRPSTAQPGDSEQQGAGRFLGQQSKYTGN